MKEKYKIKMIISGGQTGVDQAALEFALSNSIRCSGWCPAGRRSESGKIPRKFPLIELKTRHYPPRTRKNIENSDATLIIYNSKLKGGTKLTFDYANRKRKPVLCLKQKAESPVLLLNWLYKIKPEILNIAGPRFSENSELFYYTIQLLSETLTANTKTKSLVWPPKMAVNMTFDDISDILPHFVKNKN